METVFIDGSMGEGGGQILRTSLTLACITGKNLHLENIRAARRKPGLARQHLSCVRAAYQTILPALFLADKPSTVTVTGGTHNPWAPPFDFLAETFLPAIVTAGFDADCRLIKPGFFPVGGGKIALKVRPRRRIPNQIIDFCQPAENVQIHARIYTAKLPAHIVQRQKKLLLQSKLKFQNIEHIEVTDSDGPGNCIMIRLVAASGGSLKACPEQSRRAEGFGDGGPRTTVFTAFGQKGKPSEKVVGEVVSLAEDFLPSGAAVDRFLADQLLIYIAISNPRSGGEKPAPAKAGGCYTTNELSTHLTTNIETIKKFLPVDFTIEHQGQIHRISCKSE
jgi:RNA 3'-terminal phosphate cyclase (ATP)